MNNNQSAVAPQLIKQKKDPLFHIIKRPAMPLWQSILIRVGAVAAALIFCGILCYIMIDVNPLKFFKTMWDGVFGTERRILKMFKDLAILLCISLAITPAFKMRFWNIGAEGQVLVSGLACAACMKFIGGHLPEWALILIMAASSILAGAAWGLIPAIFKAKWDTNETLFTLMMNYVATYLVGYFLIKWTPDGSSTIGRLDHGHLPVIFNNQYALVILTVALITVAMFIYLKYSKQGYEISVVGESQRTAQYIGINVKKVIIRTMAISGALCGIAGLLIVGALDHTITKVSVGGQGFTAIMVSWLAKFNPFTMILTSFLIIFLQQGTDKVVSDFGINNTFPNIVTGIILFFIIGCEFFINYRIVFRKKEAKQ